MQATPSRVCGIAAAAVRAARETCGAKLMLVLRHSDPALVLPLLPWLVRIVAHWPWSSRPVRLLGGSGELWPSAAS